MCDSIKFINSIRNHISYAEFILNNKEINPEETPMEEMTEGKLNQVLGLLVKMDTAKQKEGVNA